MRTEVGGVLKKDTRYRRHCTRRTNQRQALGSQVLEGSRGSLLATSPGHRAAVRCLRFLFGSWPFRCHPASERGGERGPRRVNVSLSSPPLSAEALVLRERERGPRVGGERRRPARDGRGKRGGRERKNFLPVGTLACHHPRAVS